jgi:hypothetical protein
MIEGAVQIRKPKVDNLDIACLGDENVLNLEI